MKIRLIAAVLLFLAAGAGAQAASVFNRGNIGEPDSLDPHLTTSGYSGNIIFEMFVGLTTLDAAANVIPGAAESWEISPDGKLYTFTLRGGMLWSDGTPVTASDFEYAFRRTMDPATASRAAPLLYMIENARAVNTGQMPVQALGVKAVDARTFEVRLTNPTPYFLELIVHRCFPVPRWAIEEHGAAWTRPENIVVNGAFKLAEWIPNSRIKLVRNPMFFAAGTVALDEVNYYVTEDVSSAYNRYRAGGLDMIVSFPPSELEWLRGNMPQDLRISQNLGLEYIAFNTRRPPFDDPRVRRALALALDRETLTAKVMRGGEIAADSLIPPAARKGYDPPPAPWDGLAMPARMARAKALLAEAGYGPGNPLHFTFRFNTNDVIRRVILAAAAMWKPLGVEAEPLNSDLNTLNADLRNGDYDVARYQWFAEVSDPQSFLYLLESGSVGDNHSKYGNPDYDAVMRRMYAAVDPAERAALMRQAEAIVLEDAPITPITYYVSRRLVKPFVTGIENNVRGINISRYVGVNRPEN